METGKNNSERNCFGQTSPKDLPASANLLIECESDQLSFSIIDLKTNQCVGLCSFLIDHASSSKGIRGDLKASLESHEIFSHSFSKIQFIVSNRECVFIPEEVFIEDEKESYIRSSFTSDFSGRVLSQSNPLLKNHLVYVLPDWLSSTIEEKLSGSLISHATSLLADAVFRLSRKLKERIVHAHFKRNFFELFIMENGKMLFYNSFSYQTSEDIAYFIMYALKQWDVSIAKVSLSGVFHSDSDELYWLKKYVGELVNFPEKELLHYPAAIEFPSAYINLLNPSSCE